MTAPTNTGPAAARDTAPQAAPSTDAVPLHTPVIAWFEANARDLPWRRPEAGAWGVMVSEFMLQQTPVARVLPVYEQWLARWPRPADLAAEAPGEAVRAWGRLGYPRRALRLHGAAVAITERHGGEVPDDHDELLALPGVGEYTAAAVASFAFGRRHAVLDTNVRRVLARAVTGVQYPPTATTAAERRLAVSLLPADEGTAARWAAASMELGALVCTARNESCHRCPVASRCAWRQAGKPEHDGPPRRGQTYAGTDRQVRGKLLAVLRAAEGPVPQAALDAVWDEPVQRARALDGLVADGLVEPLDEGLYRLPG
ncbi:A/G-specific adenine glycosylase [Streptomyces sp. NPDC002644]